MKVIGVFVYIQLAPLAWDSHGQQDDHRGGVEAGLPAQVVAGPPADDGADEEPGHGEGAEEALLGLRPAHQVEPELKAPAL